MTRLFATTAVAMLACLPLALPAAAQAPLAGPDPTARTVGGPTAIGRVRASDMLGRTVYMAEAASTLGLAPSGPSENWQEIGAVADVLISGEGRLAEVVVDIGGMLGEDQRLVGVGFDTIRLIPDADNPLEGFFVVYTGNRGALESQGPWDWDSALRGEGRTDMDGVVTTGTPPSEAPSGAETGTTGGMTEVEVGPEGVPRGGNLSEGSPEIERTDDRTTPPPAVAPREPGEALAADRGPLTAEELVGSEVVGAEGEVIGRIDELVMTPQGEISAVVVEVGGFLGIGARSVAIPFENVRMQGVGGDAVLRSDYTREQIEALEEYGG